MTRAVEPQDPMNIDDPVLAQRYHAGLAELRRATKRWHPLLANRALNLAINECERARRYKWNELTDKPSLVSGWDGATKAARKLAKAIEQFEPLDGWVLITEAAQRSGLKITGSTRRQAPNIAVASFLRELSKVRLRYQRGGDGFRYGPLVVYVRQNEKLALPSTSVAVTLSLSHLFRLASLSNPDADLIVNQPSKLSRAGNPCWQAAAAFAAAAVGLGDRDEPAKIEAAAKRWRTRHKEVVYGWPYKDRRGKK